MELKLVMYNITKQVHSCICDWKKNDRLTPMPIVATWIYQLAWIQILKMNIVDLIFVPVVWGRKRRLTK